MQTNIYGKRGEIIAANYLKKKGYKILAQNYKNRIGEIDIIALDGEYIVFVEVKTRMSRQFGDPLEAIDYRKQAKIRSVATCYLKANGLYDHNCRFDAIAVLGEGDDDVRHIRDAF